MHVPISACRGPSLVVAVAGRTNGATSHHTRRPGSRGPGDVPNHLPPDVESKAKLAVRVRVPT
jgi:hypothetical protein